MSDLLVDRRNGVVFVMLNRPQALNALNFPMIRGLDRVLDEVEKDPAVWAICLRGAGERAFCAGGDIKAAREGGLAWKAGTASFDDTFSFFEEEYALNRRLFHFTKPLIALMDGITMGGGVGIAGPCRYKIATEKTLWAMPEVTIGFFPDVGAGYYLTRAPGYVGRYLGLTGQPLGNATDLINCGFATHYMPSSEVGGFTIALNLVKSEEGLVELLAEKSTTPSLPAQLERTKIDQHFCHDTVEEILVALDAGDEWAQKTAALMRAKSPTSLAVTLKHLQLSAKEGFDQVSLRDVSLSSHFLKGDDLYEGIRAAVVDKDRNPKWAELGDVNAYFI